MNHVRGLLAVWIAALLGACQTNPYFNPAKPHHTPEGFRNNHPHQPPQDFSKWKEDQRRDGLPRIPEGGWERCGQRPEVRQFGPGADSPRADWEGFTPKKTLREGASNAVP